jgi:hypothetical protein
MPNANQQFSWKYPGNIMASPDSTFDIPSGDSIIEIPPNYLQRFRNLSMEFMFSGLTASDNGMVVRFYRANSNAAFSAPNIEEVGSPITINSTITANTTAVFLRDIANLNNHFFRAVITAPSSVTANVILNVAFGGQRL